MRQLLSFRAYARHRECTLAAVQKAIASGRITPVVDEKGRKRIDPEVADIQWARNTDQLQSLRANGAPLAQPGDDGDEDPASAAAAIAATERRGSPKTPEYAAAQTDLVRASAALQQLKLRTTLGELVAAEPILRAITDTHTAARNAILALPDRLAATLATESDPERVYNILQAECEQVCRTMQRSAENLQRLSATAEAHA